jgi:hypothetical protein
VSSFLSAKLSVLVFNLNIFLIVAFLVRGIERIIWSFRVKLLMYLLILLQIYHLIWVLSLLVFSYVMIIIVSWLDFFHIRLVELQRFVLTKNMFNELIFTVVFCSAVISQITNVRFVLDMSSLVIISVSNCCKHFGTELAWVWFFPSVNSLMNLQITSFVEHFITKNLGFWAYVISNRLMTNEFSLYFLTLVTNLYSYNFIN